MQALASEAGVSSATIYRWWPSKEAVLMDGFLEGVNSRQPETGTADAPLDALREHVVETAAFLDEPDGQLLRRLIAASQDQPDVREALLERFFAPRHRTVNDWIDRAKSTLREDVDSELLFDLLVGALFYRALIRHAPADASYASAIFDIAYRGARREVGPGEALS